MTPVQQLNYELQQCSTEAEAFFVWTRHRKQLKDTALILSLPGRSPFGVRLPKYLEGSGRLISLFVHDDLFFLNDHIYTEMAAGRECTFPITYTVSFDTNAASYLRGLFEGRDTAAHKDLQNLLLHVYPHKLNWQVVPYLFENADAIVARTHDVAIFQTILAAERLENIDIEHLRQTGEVRLVDDENQAISRAAKTLSDIARHFTNGTHSEILERWEAIYVTVLFMAIEQIQKPGVERAPKKLKALIEFMDGRLHALFLEFLFVAWDWFNGGKQTSIFSKLQKNTPSLLAKARNISWDVLHVMQMRQEATFVERKGSFLVPFFLTFDQALADLVSLCAIKSCLVRGTFHYPVCFTNQDPEALFLPAIGRDEEFIERYLSVEANTRRSAWLDKHGRPNLTSLRHDLENQLLKYG